MTKEAESYIAKFKETSGYKMYELLTKEIVSLNTQIKNDKEAIKVLKQNQKEDELRYKKVMDEMLENKETALAKVGKTSKIKTIIGRLATIFKKKEKNKTDDKSSLNSFKAKIANLMENIQKGQNAAFEKVAGITGVGKNFFLGLGKNINTGVRTWAARINDSKNRKIDSMTKYLEGKAGQQREKVEKFKAGKEEEGRGE